MKLDMDLQSWTELISAICNRDTPYEQLPEHEQVADRLVLEKIEELLDLCDPDMRQWITETLQNKLQQSRGKTDVIEPIYSRQEFDSPKSWQGFQDYLKLPAANRSVPELHKIYAGQIQETKGLNQAKRPPTMSYSTLESWCAKCRWIERSQDYDLDQAALNSGRKPSALTRRWQCCSRAKSKTW